MTRNAKLTTGTLTLQLAFTLACFGGTGYQSPAGVGVGGDLDDTRPPSVDEAPALQGDGRCDWLGAPFAASDTERVLLLRFSDTERDCDEDPTVERKLLFAIDPVQARPVMDLSSFENVRVMNAATHTFLFVQDSEDSDTTRLFELDGTDLDIRRQDTIAGTFESIRPSASRRWLAARTESGRAIRVLDSETLQTSVIAGGSAAQHAWSASGDTLFTVTHDNDEAQLSIWDFEGVDTAPEAPTTTLSLAGSPAVLDPLNLVLSADGNFAAFSITSNGIDNGRTALVDLRTHEVHRIPEMHGSPAFTGNGQLVAVSGRGLRAVDLETLEITDIDLDLDTPAVAVSQGAPLLLAGSQVEENVGFVDPLTGIATRIPADDLEFGTWTADGDVIYMAIDERVLRADLTTGEFQVVSVPAFRHLLWLPRTGRLYADGTAMPVVRLIDPTGTDAPIRYDLAGPMPL